MLITLVSIFSSVVVGANVPQPQSQTHVKYGSSTDVKGKPLQLLKSNLAFDKNDAIADLAPVMFFTSGCYPYPAFDTNGLINWDKAEPKCIDAKFGQLYARKVVAMRELKKATAVIYAWRAFVNDDTLGWRSTIVWGNTSTLGEGIATSDPGIRAIWTEVGGNTTKFVATRTGGPFLYQVNTAHFYQEVPQYNTSPMDTQPKDVEGALTWRHVIDIDLMHLASGTTLGQVIDAMAASDGCPLTASSWQKLFKARGYCTKDTCPETWITFPHSLRGKCFSIMLREDYNISIIPDVVDLQSTRV